MKGLLGGEYDYLKLEAQVNQKLKVNPFGFLYYTVQAGRIWGDVPFPLMKIHEGNDTYAYDFYAFNMMNMQEFVSDKYASIFLEHHFQGYFLNKIPLFRRLKWRELAGVHTLWGNYDPSHHTSMLFPEGMKGLQNNPYTELSLGLENVFKVFKIVGIWRTSKLDYTGSQFGIVGSVQIVL
jgi:phage pi2 protein 07